MRARAAVAKIPAVQSVVTDMNAHTLTVAFDDQEVLLDQIVQSLNEAGYTVPKHSKKQ